MKYYTAWGRCRIDNIETPEEDLYRIAEQIKEE